MSQLICVYFTASSKNEAESIASELLNARLVACCNIVSGAQSMYWWKGQLEQSQEWVVFAKTRASLFSKICKKIRSLHSYKNPAITSWKLSKCSKDYSRWIESETHVKLQRSAPVKRNKQST